MISKANGRPNISIFSLPLPPFAFLSSHSPVLLAGGMDTEPQHPCGRSTPPLDSFHVFPRPSLYLFTLLMEHTNTPTNPPTHTAATARPALPCLSSASSSERPHRGAPRSQTSRMRSTETCAGARGTAPLLTRRARLCASTTGKGSSNSGWYLCWDALICVCVCMCACVGAAGSFSLSVCVHVCVYACVRPPLTMRRTRLCASTTHANMQHMVFTQYFRQWRARRFQLREKG